MKLKRLLSLILTLAMLLSVVPTAFAAGETVATGSCGENVTWTLDSEGTLIISGNGGLGDYSELSYREHRDSIKKLVLEKGISYLPEQAFYNYPIEEIYFLGNCPEIEYNAFEGVTATAYYPEWNFTWNTKPYLEGDVEWIDDGSEAKVEIIYSGEDCSGLGEIGWELNNLGELRLYGWGETGNWYAAGESPWSKLAGFIGSITVEPGINYIGDYAFANVDAEYVSIPGGMDELGDKVFYGCCNIQEIKFAGDAPNMSGSSFWFATTYHTPVLSYPAGNSSWDRIADSNTYDLRPYEPDCAHSFGAWESYIEASCGSEGEERRYCSLCHTAEKRVSSIGDHIWDEGEVFIEPTEYQTGKMKYTCTRCGELRMEDIPVLTPHEHEFTRGECTVCGHSVLFDGWLAPDFAEGDYSFVAIPDTQGMVDLWPNEYYKQMKWIADNKDELNIQAVFHMGDMVESNSEGYWSIAKMGTDYLDRAGIVWMPMRGNHDDSEFFNEYYGHFSGKSWFVDSLEGGKLDVCAWSFTAGGRDYMVLNLGWAPTVVELGWATELAANNTHKNIIVLCHAYMNGDNSLLDWDTDLTPELKEQFVAKLPSGLPFEMAIKAIPDGEAIWAAFKEYENVVLAMSGHVHSENIGVFTDNNAAGRPVSSLLIDRQEDDDTEHLGMLAVLSFSEDTDEVQVHWYSTRYDAFYGEKSSFAITVPHLSGETEEESHVHQYVPGTVTEATCTKAGFTTYVCSCGASYDDGFTSALGHSWDEGVITKEPTESAEGEKTSTCTRCGKTRTERVPSLSHEHSYSQTVTAPGCTEKGYTTHKCVCGDSYKDNYTDALGHNWDEGVVTKEPTEGAEGEKTFTCLVCGETEIRAIASSSTHTHSYTVGSVTEATCTKAGFTTFVCSCGASYDDGFTSALGHSWDEGVITKEPTESAEGEKLFTCTRCEKTRTESVPKLEHTHKHEAAVTAPTCTEQGFTTHSCPCGDSYTDSFTEALGHSWDEGKVTKEPTTEAEGEKTYTCTVCSETRTEAMEKLPPDCGGKHSWDKGSVTKEPTKDSKGEMLYTCTVCGETKTEDLAKLPSADDFKDVRRSDYFYESVEWALDEGITAGVGADTFGPTQACTRAQVVTFLWRAAGEPAPRSENNPFTDVQKGQYYYEAVLWAVEQGITDGVSATSFAPNMSCTRAQVVTFLWRAAGEPEPRRDSSDFTDVKNGDYYASPVFWAVENKITSGLSEGSFGPDASCTRAQVVTFLYRAFR